MVGTWLLKEKERQCPRGSAVWIFSSGAPEVLLRVVRRGPLPHASSGGLQIGNTVVTGRLRDQECLLDVLGVGAEA